jgi:hypothetical protein
VAEGVVDALEEVEIHDHQAEPASIAPRPRKFRDRHFEPGAPGVDAGEHVGADQPREMVAGRLQLAHAIGEVRLQRGDARADLYPSPQFLGVDRLDHVVVGAGVQSGHEIRAAAAAGEKEHIHPRQRRVLSDAPADLEAIDAGHHPVDDREVRGQSARERLPRHRAVGSAGHVYSPALQRAAQNRSRDWIIVGHQCSHPRRSGKRGTAGISSNR